MTIHIGATIDEIADTVLLPGDPMRAKWAAEQFLTSPRLVNNIHHRFSSYEGERYNVPTQIEFRHCTQLDSFGVYYLYR